MMRDQRKLVETVKRYAFYLHYECHTNEFIFVFQKQLDLENVGYNCVCT